MDRGIKARWLEQRLLALAHDRRVKAVVFRVDSPGGDPLASDVVAQALKSGFLFVFDRATGEPVWPIEERPVGSSAVPGEEAFPN